MPIRRDGLEKMANEGIYTLGKCAKEREILLMNIFWLVKVEELLVEISDNSLLLEKVFAWNGI